MGGRLFSGGRTGASQYISGLEWVPPIISRGLDRVPRLFFGGSIIFQGVDRVPPNIFLGARTGASYYFLGVDWGYREHRGVPRVLSCIAEYLEDIEEDRKGCLICT